MQSQLICQICFESFNSKQRQEEIDVTRSGQEFGLEINIFPLINSNSYVTTRTKGFVVFVHNKSFKPTQEVFLKYGEMTFISVNRVFTQKYPSPYSDCIDLELYKSDFYDYIIKTNRTYRQEDCFELCIQKSIIDKCQCYYTKYDDLNLETRPCLNQTDSECLEERINNFNLQECQSNSCPLECDTITYETTVSSMDFDKNFYENEINNNKVLEIGILMTLIKH